MVHYLEQNDKSKFVKHDTYTFFPISYLDYMVWTRIYHTLLNISVRADHGDASGFSELSSFPPSATASSAFTLRSTTSSSTSTPSYQPLTVLNVDDYFVMKASSECK